MNFLKVCAMPKKADFRMHAHCNPLIETLFPYPLNPDYVDWGVHFPKHFGLATEKYLSLQLNTLEYPITYSDPICDDRNGKQGRSVDFLDMYINTMIVSGCGFGGLTFALASRFPENLVMGMEIRSKVVNYVGEKVRALRQ